VVLKVQPLSTLDYPQSELVFGLVYAAGTNDKPILHALEDHIKTFGYKPNPIRLSDYLKGLVKKLRLGVDLEDSSEFVRINSHMDAGNKVHMKSNRGDFLALRACAQIGSERKARNNMPMPIPKTVHILLSLKRPEEVNALRRIYGPGFFLVGVFATEEERLKFLMEDKSIPRAEAEKLIQRDEEETEEFGQRTRDTFYMADVFVRLTAKEFKQQLWRFMDLVFGHPFMTPTPDENAMFLAYAASTRSAAYSRQVGAAITSNSGEIIGVGCNDVPQAGGGLYWPDKFDQRDHVFKYKDVIGVDSNAACRDEIINDIMDRLRPEISKEKRLEKGKYLLKGSPILDITEYGRAVHAEMEAILACARASVSPVHGTLYTTTFPCHNCARHIIAAGIERVVYIEPYSKSRAKVLHSDSIRSLGEMDDDSHVDPPPPLKVKFEPFVGIGPRRYFDLFSLRLSTGFPKERRTKTGTARAWEKKEARIRVPMLPTSYLAREKLAVEEIAQTLKTLGGN
jgi:deoxycytidylate deaminase